MKKILLVMVCALSLCSVSASAQKLYIVHVNDTHSHLDPEREGTENAGQGGVIERAAYVDSLRNAVGKKNVLLLHAGDWDQGSSYFNVLKGNLEVGLINAMQYDCLTIGNHEFDNGIEDLGERISKIKAPVVCANYDFSPFEMGKYVTPYTIIKRGGMKIGIVGMLCDISTVVEKSTADRIPHLDDVEAANKWASYLKNEKKCDLVILLSHLGHSEDKRLIPSVSNVDVVIGGHSHTKVQGFEYVKDKDNKEVPVIQDWKWGLEIGQIEVY